MFVTQHKDSNLPASR